MFLKIFESLAYILTYATVAAILAVIKSMKEKAVYCVCLDVRLRCFTRVWSFL